MKYRIRRGKSVYRIATALCILASGSTASAGDNVPKLVKTTTRVRINTNVVPSQPFQMPSSAVSSSAVSSSAMPVAVNTRVDATSTLRQVSEEAPTLREFLDAGSASPDRALSSNPKHGVPRTNRFVELHSQADEDHEPRSVSGSSTEHHPHVYPTRSAAIPRRSSRRSGQIQKNPLVVDAPPQLRRFPVQNLPLAISPNSLDSQAEDVLIVKQPKVPEREISDLDQAMELLSTATDDVPAMRHTVRNGGFGMLAMDQIGQHMPPPTDHDSDLQSIQQFTADLDLPPSAELSRTEMQSRIAAATQVAARPRSEDAQMADLSKANSPQSQSGPNPLPTQTPNVLGSTLREQFHLAASQGLIEDDRLLDQPAPQLPPPNIADTEQDSNSKSIAQALSAFSANDLNTAAQRKVVGNAAAALPSPIKADASTGTARDISELLAAENRSAPALSKNSAAPQTATVPTKTAEKSPSFAQRFSGWSKKLTSGRKSAPSKPASARISSKSSQTESQPRKRSGGILTQWLNKSNQRTE